MKVSKLTKTSSLFIVVLSFAFVFVDLAIADSWTIDRLTDDVREEHAPVWSPDGTKIAYISRPETGGGTGELHVIDLTTGSLNIIYDYVATVSLHWVGDYIAFVKREQPYVPDAGDNEVWKIKEDGTGLQQITFTYTNGIDQHIWGHDGVGTASRAFALSPDGSKLAFVAHHGNGWFDPYVCNADGSDGYVLLQNLSHCDYIKWNGDGSKVYYAAGSDYYPPQTMYRSNPDGSGDETITGDLPERTDFAFSPDGSTVAMITGIFHRPCKGAPPDQIDRNLSIMNPDGSGRTDLLNDSFDDAFGNIATLADYDPPYARHPSFHVWTPDNETIVFTSDRSGNFDIWTIKKDGTNLTQITVDTARDYDAGFSPDGTKIVFISERDGQRDLYLMDAEAAECCPGTDGSLGDGLVAYYPFEGNADDPSGNGNHGVENGGPSYVGGVCGEAISLDGVDDYIDMGAPSTFRITGPLTVGTWFWAEPEALVSDMLIVSRTGRDVNRHWCWKLGLLYSVPWASISENGYSEASATGPDAVSSVAWHHLAVTYQPDDFINLYLDGELVGEVLGDTVPDNINDPYGVPVFVGAFYREGLPPGHPFPGKIDEVRIYDRALSGCEIRELACAPEPTIEAAIDIDPDTLNLNSKGKWVTCYISLPGGYDVASIDSESVMLEEAVAVDWMWFDEEVQVAMAKFSRSAVEELLVELGLLGDVELIVTGELADGTKFEGRDTIRVIDKGGKKK